MATGFGSLSVAGLLLVASGLFAMSDVSSATVALVVAPVVGAGLWMRDGWAASRLVSAAASAIICVALLELHPHSLLGVTLVFAGCAIIALDLGSSGEKPTAGWSALAFLVLQIAALTLAQVVGSDQTRPWRLVASFGCAFLGGASLAARALTARGGVLRAMGRSRLGNPTESTPAGGTDDAAGQERTDSSVR